MKEIKTKLYKNYIDSFKYNLKAKRDYTIVVNRIMELPVLCEMPELLSPNQFIKIRSEFLLESIVLKLDQINDYIKDKDKVGEYKSVRNVLIGFLKKDRNVFSIDRKELDHNFKINRIENRKFYITEKRRCNKSSDNVKLEYRVLCKRIIKNWHNIYGASSTLSLEGYKSIKENYSEDSIIEIFESLNNFEYLAISETSIFDFFYEKAEYWEMPVINSVEERYRNMLIKAKKDDKMNGA